MEVSETTFIKTPSAMRTINHTKNKAIKSLFRARNNLPRADSRYYNILKCDFIKIGKIRRIMITNHSDISPKPRFGAKTTFMKHIITILIVGSAGLLGSFCFRK